MESPTEVIVCRCGLRHPLGTEWCSCGSYLPHEGTIVAATAKTPSVGVADESPQVIAPAPSWEPPGEEAAGGAVEPGPAPKPPSSAARMVHTSAATSGDSSSGAIQPGVQQITGGPDSVFDDRLPQSDDQVCPDSTCHVRNDATLVFCRRCGTELRSVGGLEFEGNPGWWARLKAKLTGTDLKSKAMGAKYQVRRAKGLKTRARMFRTALLGGALGAAGMGLSPAIRSQVLDRVKDVTFADRYAFVNVEAVSTSAGLVSGWEPQLILDGSYNRAWGAVWGPNTPGYEVVIEGAGCVEGPYPRLRFDLTDEVDIDRLRIWAGTWEEDEARELRPRPKVLQVQPTTNDGLGDCTFVELEDIPEPQDVGVDLSNAQAIDISIVAVYPGEAANDIVAISEIWFERQR